MVTFNFSFAPGTSLQQMVGFEMAGRVWSSFLADNFTVNIHVGVASSLPGNVIGGALPGIHANQAYQQVYRGLEADRSSLDDLIAVDNLSSKADYEAWFDEFDRKNGKNSGEKIKAKEMSLTRANARAIGILNGQSSELDGVIVFGGLAGSNYQWNYDFTRSSAAPANTLDFLGTAVHEIGHVLGFVSGVDKPGWLNSAAPDKQGAEAYKQSLKDRIAYTTPLDLFRYSAVAGYDLNDLSYGSVGADKFFSIDGGRSAIAQFSTGLDNGLGGDGKQASHWKYAGTGIMAPTLSPQARPWISTTDLRAMDVMGWNLRSGSTLVNLATLQTQAEQSLAQQLGASVTWLSENAETAAQQLGRDRSDDINDMIRRSDVYNWGTRPAGSAPPPPPGPLRQVLELMQQQVVYASFETLDTERVVSEAVTTQLASLTIAQKSGESFAGRDRASLELQALAVPTLEDFKPLLATGQIDLSWLEHLEHNFQSGRDSERSANPRQHGRKFTDDLTAETIQWAGVYVLAFVEIRAL